MKLFKGFNKKGPPCEICRTKDDKSCTLLPVYGTNKDSESPLTYDAVPVHVDCLELGAQFFPRSLFIIQEVELKKGDRGN